MLTAYLIHLLILFAVFAIAALALDLTFGGVGIINLGFLGLVAVGAYASAILTTRFGWPVAAAVLVGMALAATIALVLGFLVDRVRGDALAVILFGFNFMVYTVALNWTGLTRGSLGIPGIPRPSWILEDRWYLVIALACLAVSYLALRQIHRSRFGRVLGAVRDDEMHARVLGKRARRAKIMAFVVSGAFAGLAGALYAHFLRFIDPGSFYIPQLVLVLSMIFLGGIGSPHGILFGAAMMTFLPELVDAIPGLPTTILGALRAIVFASLLLLIVLFRPKGLFGKIEMPPGFGE